ncbi:NUDIX domain-containing protein [Candidatus Woesearchaeota archaeon]|nr:NUDIX domain-containing protein [Candidatus Woesearchaeota archaeon]
MGKGYERVDVVDSNDFPITTAYRFQVDTFNLRARASRVIILGKEGIWVQRRSPEKPVYASKLEVGIGEMALAGESYTHAAQRGVQEELLYGQCIPLEDICVRGFYPFKFSDRLTTRNYQVYVWDYDGKHPLSLESEETSSGRFVSKEELKIANKGEFTPIGWLMAKCALFYCEFGLIQMPANDARAFSA